MVFEEASQPILMVEAGVQVSADDSTSSVCKPIVSSLIITIIETLLLRISSSPNRLRR